MSKKHAKSTQAKVELTEENSILSKQLTNTKNLSAQLQTQLTNLISHYEEQVALVMKMERDLKRRSDDLEKREREIAAKEIQLKQDEERLLREMEEKEKEKMKELLEREERIAAIEQKMASSTSISTRLGKNQVVKLNVGGKIFATNLQTITSVKETFFTGYFNDHFNPTPEEDDKAFFIDRPFEQFHLILNYLRGIDIKQKLSDLSESELKDFIEEVVYYQITPIYEILPPKGIRLLRSKYNITLPCVTGIANKFDSNYCSSNLTLTHNETRVKKTGNNGFNAFVLGEEGNQFKVKLNSQVDYLMIGFAPRTVNLNGNNSKCGYYLFAINGTLYSQNGDLGKSYASKISAGSIVECKFENGNISFIVNGVDKGIAFSNIPNEPKLYPAFDVYDNGCDFEFVE